MTPQIPSLLCDEEKQNVVWGLFITETRLMEVVKQCRQENVPLLLFTFSSYEFRTVT